MPRKLSLPGADELFRPTAEPAPAPAEPVAPTQPARAAAGSGRVRHDEKITVYVSRDELLALEQLRLQLRGEFGIAADRGRIVREALALTLDDVATRGEDAALVRRLRAS